MGRPSELTLIDAGRSIPVSVIAEDERVWVSAEAATRILGWQLKPEGLCRGNQCIPVPAGSTLVGPLGLDLASLAEVLQRPLALDLDERAAYLGASAPERGAALATLEAPDFTLPDLAGRTHTLSAHRGKKVLLVAYASW